jgi:hypothetical protein
MVRVAQNDVGADRFQIAMRHRFDGTLRPDRHERGRLDDAVRRVESAPARLAVARDQLE